MPVVIPLWREAFRLSPCRSHLRDHDEQGAAMANTKNLEYQLADIVAQHYDIGRPVEVHTLQATRNHTLAIVTDGGRYAVRMRGDAWWIGHESELEFELDLLDHLARDGLAVSTAVPQRDGSRVGILDDGTLRRTYSLFTWGAGSPRCPHSTRGVPGRADSGPHPPERRQLHQPPPALPTE